MNHKQYKEMVMTYNVNNEYSKEIYRRDENITLEDIAKAHELGAIEFLGNIIFMITSDNIIYYDMIVKINGIFSYLRIKEDNVSTLNKINNIKSFYQEYDFKPIKYNVENSFNGLKFIEVCDEYISIISEYNTLMFFEKNDKFYDILLTVYNLNLIEYERH